MTRQQWWQYVREDRIGLVCVVVALVGIVAAIVTGHLP